MDLIIATVKILVPREQAAHFGLYRTSAGGSQSIFVRRKVGEPTDTTHSKSRKLKRQRANLALASQHYASLTPSQKAITRHQFEEVPYQRSHGKTDLKLLTGRQLFISKEMLSLSTRGSQLILPLELCILLVDFQYNPLGGNFWLRYFKAGEWLDCEKEELATGSWLMSQVPRGQEAYRPYGDAVGYYDPQLPETQNMTEEQILAYRYHVLYSGQAQPGYSFAAAYWIHFYVFTSPMTASSIRVVSKLYTYDFDGTLKVGLKAYEYPYPLDNWITVRTHPVSASNPDPKEFESTLLGCGLVQGERYLLCHELVGNLYNYWKGYIAYSIG